eukprot:CAMPEP_0119015530 /NCGR_PEP_ID=MMETSP1176-20130426/11186_1 /TAXON_ID=265551 /ORGANISM="Synedropsis recta cf, Strain CCMP1620" /LENGTH=135 /DNA_ID=CAMNT_0006968829 /DNA_START=124 /DNA_END=531 /DNA_ORIENTATION=+
MNDWDENEPERPAGCVDAFGLARAEAKHLFKEISERLGCAIDDDDIADDWSLKDAMEPAQDEASIILEEMGSWLEEYQPAIDQAKANVRASGRALSSEAAKAVKPLTSGVAAAIEPAAEEARLLVSELRSRSSKK